MKFFEEKYTKRCVVNKPTTYPKFRLGSLPLIVQYYKIMAAATPRFSNFDLFFIKNGFQKILEIDNFIEKKNAII
jgi:hypothetical protein